MRSNFAYEKPGGADHEWKVISWIEFFLGPESAGITELIDTDADTLDWFQLPILMPQDLVYLDNYESFPTQSVIEQVRSSTLVGDVGMFVMSMTYDLVTIPVGTAFEDNYILSNWDCWDAVFDAPSSKPWHGNMLDFSYGSQYANGFPLNKLGEGGSHTQFYETRDSTHTIYGSCIIVPYKTSIAPYTLPDGTTSFQYDDWQTVWGYIYISNPHPTSEDKPCGVYINGVYDNSADGFNNKMLNGIQCLTFERRHVISSQPMLWTDKISHDG